MKNSVFLLLIILLSSTFLNAASLSSAVLQTGSNATSNIEPNASYLRSGHHVANAVDYYWVSGVNQGDLFLLNVQMDPFSGWDSVLFYSNLDLVQDIGGGGTHIFEFTALKTDSYLLRITGGFSFDFNITGNHPITEQQPMYSRSGHHVANAVDYYWVSEVSKGDLFLLNVRMDPFSGWDSVLFYSNLTVVQDIGGGGTHIFELIAGKTDSYLLRITGGFSFDFNITGNHPITEQQPMYSRSGHHVANAVDYYWVSEVSKGDLFLLNVRMDPFSGWDSVLFYSNLTVVQDIGGGGTHIFELIAGKTDSYLLRITGGFSFDFNITGNHPITEQQPMYSRSGHHVANAVDYYWVSEVSKGDLFLLNVRMDPFSGWDSVLFYSNLTVVQDIGGGGTHIFELIAGKTDSYLLRITGGFSFDFNITANHPISHNHDSEQLQLAGVSAWSWTSNTNITSTVTGDVDGDGQVEVVTGGYYNDGVRNVAQLCVWSGSGLVLENVKTWYWTGNTVINSVAVGDVDGDGQVEVVTGGYYNDGVRNVAQLCVWSGSGLVLENVKTWYWTGNTVINSVAVGDVDNDGLTEVITGGSYFDGARNNAQLVEWVGSSLAVDRLTRWYWTGNTVINSVAVGDVDGDGQVEVVTGGYYNDGVRNNAQLIEWSGASLSVDRLTRWYWTGNTVINSVALGDADDDSQIEIVTGGYYNDGTRNIAQLVEWKGSNLAIDRLTSWYWTGNTAINSIAIGYLDTEHQTEIVTGGQFNDGTRNNSQLVVWSGSILTAEYIKSWYWTSDTAINSVAIGDVNNNFLNDVVTGGFFYDGARANSQLTVWGMT